MQDSSEETVREMVAGSVDDAVDHWYLREPRVRSALMVEISVLLS